MLAGLQGFSSGLFSVAFLGSVSDGEAVGITSPLVKTDSMFSFGTSLRTRATPGDREGSHECPPCRMGSPCPGDPGLFLEVRMFRVLVLDDSPERLDAFVGRTLRRHLQAVSLKTPQPVRFRV
jgi:hypothetical protein